MDGSLPSSGPDPAPPAAPKVPDKGKRDEWSEGGVLCLLEVYESKWVLRNRAKLKGSDWEEIARLVSMRCSGTKALKTPTQCKNKIEALKKRYRSESTLTHDPTSTSSWQFYSRMDDLLKGSVNCLVNPKSNHGIDLQALPKAETDVEVDDHLHDSNHDDGSNTMPIDVNTNADKIDDKRMDNRGVYGNLSTPRIKEATADMVGGSDPGSSSKKRKVTVSEVAESIRLLAQSILQIEQARMEMYKDSERMRAETEIKRGEMELKRTEIIANTQLQIAKLFMRRMHKGSNQLGDRTMGPQDGGDRVPPEFPCIHMFLAHDLKMEDKEASLARHTNGFKHETWKAPHRHLPIGLLPKQVDCTHRNVNRLALWLRDSFDAVY
ncbi:hypothetical protein ZIOFF_069760 [Zingiber officinale]|uniref:Myb/SANT-like DNA-binding domain-containing protein n=1 Tax=Zingiber officinale TaxID=94328 RepID=A0A8J5C4K4_ZINOF|nr:hypothetical protein ZIOFF_069760 [Zingiber officinale]